MQTLVMATDVRHHELLHTLHTTGNPMTAAGFVCGDTTAFRRNENLAPGTVVMVDPATGEVLADTNVRTA